MICDVKKKITKEDIRKGWSLFCDNKYSELGPLFYGEGIVRLIYRAAFVCQTEEKV
jgi:hypothetical protein